MADEPNFFAMPAGDEQPPMVAPPVVEDAPMVETMDAGEEETGGFTLLGDAPQPPADGGFGDEGLGFAAAPSSDTAFEDAQMGFAGAPPADGGYAPPSDDPFGAPAGDAPIILGAPPPETVEDDAPPVPEEPSEPTPMQKWNEEWQTTLVERKEEENSKKSELVEAARVALESFQKDRETKRDTKMAKNREDEQAKLEAIEADLENDNSWQRVCKMVELSHEGSLDAGEDVKRMRDVMILLKNEPTRAASVGA